MNKKYSFLITGSNLLAKLKPYVKKSIDNTLARKVRFESKSINDRACNYCLLEYPFSCMHKKENGIPVNCNAEWFFVSPAMDYLKRIKKRRF